MSVGRVGKPWNIGTFLFDVLKSWNDDKANNNNMTIYGVKSYCAQVNICIDVS